MGDGSGNGDALHFSAREGGWVGVRSICDAHAFKQGFDSFSPLLARLCEELKREFDIFACSEGWKEVEELEYGADAGPPAARKFFAVESVEVFSAQPNLSRVGGHDSAQAMQ